MQGSDANKNVGQSSEGDAVENKAYIWYVLAMMLLLYMMNIIDRYVASGLLERIKQDFQVSDSYMGFLVGPAFAIIYTSLALPIARLADRISRIKIIVTGALVWSMFTVMSGYTNTPETFALARLGVGVGEAAFFAPAISLLSDYFSPGRRAFAFAILNFGVYFGQIIGLGGGAAIADAYHWRVAFIVLGAPGIFLAIIALLTIREPLRGRLDGLDKAASTATMSFAAALRALFSKKSFRYIILGTACGGFAGYGFGIWAPTLFARAFELTLTEANSRYGIPSVVFGLTGAVIIGIVCDKLSARDDRWPIRLSAIGVFGSMIFMFAMCFAPNARIATLMTIPAGLLGGGWVIGVQASLQDLLPSRLRATGTAFWGFGLTFAGLALGVQFAGLMMDGLSAQFGDDAIRYALAATLLACIPSAFFLMMATKTHAQDRQAFVDEAKAEVELA